MTLEKPDALAPEFTPQHDPLRSSLAYAIRRAQVRCDQALAGFLRAGMSPAKLAALSTIGANHGISQTDLGGRLNIAGPSVVKVVDSLERLGLVCRELSPKDRRVHALRLTEQGTEEVERYRRAIANYEQSITSALDEHERTLLLTLLESTALSKRWV